MRDGDVHAGPRVGGRARVGALPLSGRSIPASLPRRDGDSHAPGPLRRAGAAPRAAGTAAPRPMPDAAGEGRIRTALLFCMLAVALASGRFARRSRGLSRIDRGTLNLSVGLALLLALSRLRRLRRRIGGRVLALGSGARRAVGRSLPAMPRLPAFTGDRRDRVATFAVFQPRPGYARRPGVMLRPRRRSGLGLAALAAIAAAASAVAMAPLLGWRLPGGEARDDPFSLPSLRSSLAPPPLSGAELDDIKVPSAAAAAGEPYRIAWPYDIADGLTFGPEGAIKTRLAGLAGPARDAVCSDRDGYPWACGLQARAALNNVTRQATLVCERAGAPSQEVVPARCRSGEVDIGRELVLAGFARADPADPVLRDAENEARAEERGLWNGGWAVRLPPAR